jgi:hypothetical protein
MPLTVITASRLRDGAIVWLDSADRWSERFADACAREGEAVARGLAVAAADAGAQHIIGAYEVEVLATPAGLRPVSTRERIRATGPSVRPDLAYDRTQVEA